MCARIDVKMRNPEVGRANLVQMEYAAFDLREPPGRAAMPPAGSSTRNTLGSGVAPPPTACSFPRCPGEGGQVEAAWFAQCRSRSRRVIRSWASGEPSWKAPIHLSSCGRLSPP